MLRSRTVPCLVWLAFGAAAASAATPGPQDESDLLVTPGQRAEARPNLIVVLADDLGYGDVHAFHPESRIPTPALDRLAVEGMRFVDAHSPSAVCTPTRYGLLTGRYCWRSSLKRGVLNGYGTPLIEPERPTVATVLRDAGYTTGIVGKWHLGLGFAKEGEAFDFRQPVSDGPHTHGFDHSFVIPASLDFPPYLYVRNGTITAYPGLTQPAQSFPAYLRQGPRSEDLVMEECLDDLLQDALSFVRREAEQEKPFFLYFPLTAPHKPVLPHSRFRGRTELGPYGDFVVQVDDTVGRLLSCLDECNIADDTLVLVTSDNGSFMYSRPAEPDHTQDPEVQSYQPIHHRANGPFRGTKADIWEAGHRVPFLVRWPGQITPGTTTTRTTCHTDIFPTLADLASAPLPEGAAPDGHSFAPTLLGQPESPRPPVVHHSVNGTFAVRKGPWKLVLGNGSGGREAPAGKPFEKPYTLFHLGKDPGEQSDVAAENPKVVAELEAVVEGMRE